MVIRPDIGAGLVRVAREINDLRSLESTLDTIVQTAARSLPGIDHVGITIAGRDGGMETKAGTDPFVWELDQLQYALGEGPCLRVIRNEAITTVEHVRREQRWPAFMRAAVEKGLRSQISLRLYTEDATLGALNM